MLGLLNSDIDLENYVLHVQRGVKQRNVRDGYEQVGPKTEMVVGKLKSASSKRDVPLNDTAIQAIKEMREEIYLGEDFPLIHDKDGNFLKPERFRRRYYRLLDGAGVEHRGLHSLRHTFATNLVNGVKQPDGTIISLTPKQVTDILGHSTSQITEMYYVKKGHHPTKRLNRCVLDIGINSWYAIDKEIPPREFTLGGFLFVYIRLFTTKPVVLWCIGF